MSLPPNVVRIKRKADDEPLEILYIQREGANKRAKAASDQFQFRRVDVDADQHVLSTISAPPKIHLSPPENSLASKPHTAGLQAQRAFSPSKGSLAPTRPHEISRGRSRHEPRRFHLMRQASSNSLNSSNRSAIQKRRTRTDVATFSEQISSRSTSRLREVKNDSGLYRQAINQAANGLGGPENARDETDQRLRKPNATATEKQWRAENWKKAQTVSKVKSQKARPADGTNEKYLKLAADLQKFALEATTSEAVQSDDPVKSKHSNIASTKLKFQPKPPPLRYHERRPSNPSDPMEDIQTSDSAATKDDGDWVYDTYVRHPNSQVEAKDSPRSGETIESSDSPEGGHLVNASQGTESGMVGFLIIRDEDEDAWEVFAENDSGSESPSLASDEEDENAEDHWANDYPEEEDSDEEGSYHPKYNSHYGHRGDDEGEYDLTIDPSDEDEDKDSENNDSSSDGESGLVSTDRGRGAVRYDSWKPRKGWRSPLARAINIEDMPVE